MVASRAIWHRLGPEALHREETDARVEEIDAAMEAVRVLAEERAKLTAS